MGCLQEARDAVERLYGQWRDIIGQVLNQYPKVALIYINIRLPFADVGNIFTRYEREFFKTRNSYENLPEGKIVQYFIDSMTNLNLMTALSSSNEAST